MSCKYCGSDLHTSLMCYNKPKSALKKRSLHTAHKTIINETTTRNRWKYYNPSVDGYWYCHYCGKPLTDIPELLEMGIDILTLDHIKARSRALEDKYNEKNLVACCMSCNTKKGSMSYEQFCKKYFPHLLKVDTLIM